jgi:hypothetical protein
MRRASAATVVGEGRGADRRGGVRTATVKESRFSTACRHPCGMYTTSPGACVKPNQSCRAPCAISISPIRSRTDKGRQGQTRADKGGAWPTAPSRSSRAAHAGHVRANHAAAVAGPCTDAGGPAPCPRRASALAGPRLELVRGICCASASPAPPRLSPCHPPPPAAAPPFLVPHPVGEGRDVPGWYGVRDAACPISTG